MRKGRSWSWLASQPEHFPWELIRPSRGISVTKDRSPWSRSRYVYTLPTEAQWEYACRAGASGDYAGELDALAWYSGNSEGETHPVAQKRPNAWGLYDMHGNVLEWCRDWYGNYEGGRRVNPKGASSGSVRVIRGGSWGYGPVFCRSAYRVRLRPDSRWVILGFRVALSPADPKPWWDFRTETVDSGGEARAMPVTADNVRRKQ